MVICLSSGCDHDTLSSSDHCQSLNACVLDATRQSPLIFDGRINDLDYGISDSAVRVRDMNPTDASVKTDIRLNEADAWQAPCEPSEGEISDTSDFILDQRITTRTPSSLGRIAALRLAPNDPNSMLFFSVSEGRLFQRSAEGALRWQTGLLGLDALNAIDDLDGDGDLEIVASGRSMIVVLDALTGRLIWSLQANDFGDSVFSTIARLLVTDLTGDGIPDIYVTNGGCGGAGDGKGLILSAQNEQFVMVQQLFGNRLNGKCGAWQTVFDVDGNGRSEIIVTDGNGLAAFDTESGEKISCSVMNAPPNGPLPTYLAQMQTGPTWLVVINEIIHQVTLQTDEACLVGKAFVSNWQFELGGPFSAKGSGLIFDEQGFATHFIFDADGSSVYEGVFSLDLTTGIALPIAVNDSLLGVLSRPDLPEPYLITSAASPSETLNLNVYERTPEGWQVRARIESTAPNLITEPAPLTSSKDFRLPIIVKDPLDNRPRFLLGEMGTVDGVQRLSLVSVNGSKRSVLDAKFSGDIRPFCPTVAPCTSFDTSIFIATNNEGAVLSFDLNRSDPPQHHFDAFSGTDQLIPIDGAPGYLGVLSRRGLLTVYRESSRGFEYLWSTNLGSPTRRTPFGLGIRTEDRPIFVMRDSRESQSEWSAFDAETGIQLWRHSLNDDEASVFNHPVMVGGSNAIFMRFDYARDNIIPSDPSCADRTPPVPPDFFTPHPNCPNKAVRPRVITALDPITGVCKWRRVFKSIYPPDEPGLTYGCPSPVNQRLSISSDHHENDPMAFVTEGMSLRTFRTNDPPDSDAWADFDDIFIFGKTAIGGNIGGGQILRSEAGSNIFIHGGATPPMHFDNVLNRIWTSQGIEAIRSQNWLLQDAVDFGRKVWTNAVGGYPLIEIDSATGTLNQYWALRDGQATPTTEFTPTHPEVRQLIRLSHEEDPMLAVTTDQDFIYFFNEAGQFVSSFQSSTPVFNLSTLNYDNRKGLLHSTGGGRISVLRPAILRNPSIVFDVTCPPLATCDPSNDIDETAQLTQLCLAWTPVENAIGYDVTVQADNGLQLKPWARIGLESTMVIDGLDLIPGERYIGVVRALFEVDTQIELSSVVYSDGVVVQQSQLPTTQLTVTVDQARRVLDIAATANDDDQLARWRVDLLDSATEQIIQRVGSGPLAVTQWSDTFAVDLSTLAMRLPGLETIIVELNVSDRVGQESTLREMIQIQ